MSRPRLDRSRSCPFLADPLPILAQHKVGRAFFYFSTLVFLSIVITVVASAPSYNSNKFVWATYTNETGWSSVFVVVMTGLVNPSCTSTLPMVGLPACVN